MPPLLIPQHHSVSDWDFALAATHYELDTGRYVSAPSSLHSKQIGGGSAYHTMLCRVAETQNIPQGELRSWRYHNNANSIFFTFRNQSPLGTANYLNCYVVHLVTTGSLLRRYVAGVPHDFSFGPTSNVKNLWQQWRTVWWNGTDAGGNDALVCELYLKVAGEWVKDGLTVYDTANQYKDSAINRAGLTTQVQSGYTSWHDDTEIWGPA